ncbi:BEL1-like homeodomain protein 7 [Actinidia eriantha]|uniref:BEL1-like homeodomain protein 7 n=1 Tax=Actinidia eriantha TaxID=165200 RepID=UPI0025874B9F|nr:BEL1-like homeodomain protein 7 [Actinidia eriantha]XP_057469516.1 BEL1-like homeodomain protein 7 [Actinidia eriantha]XP_057469517.1 BEL1-like homeodomain protein 7 [Actinidia eriantha]
MATYYPSISNQRDVLPAPYLHNQKHDPDPEPPHLPCNMMYPNQASATPYADLFSGSSLSLYDGVRSAGARDEVEFIPPTSFSVDNTSRTSIHVLDGEQNLRCQGLSLSLGTEIPAGVYVPSVHNQYADLSTSSLLSSHVGAEDGSQSNEPAALNSPYCLVGSNEMHSSPHQYDQLGLVRTIFNSQYLKATQQLLDEVVNVQKALKQFKTDDKKGNSHEFGFRGSEEIDVKMNGTSSDPLESTTDYSFELSPPERQDLQNKLTKLLSMLDEVDRRYRQYYHQMQIVISSFEMVAGRGAAKPYTTLALKTISRHFRSVHDAISSQIRVTRKNLGEQDSTLSVQGGLPRLRCVGQQLGQERALLQQFGVMRHSWRPQRGLPESSVSVLRAWLFEHFLHPYPKDSEKTMLARKTGLTRSQVANWFINARVRLWKPMVEEMYNEEFGEIDFKSSPEHAPEEAKDKLWSSEDTREAADDGQIGQFDDSKFDLIPDFGMQGLTARLGFQNAACGDNKFGSGMTKLCNDRRPNTGNHDVSPDGIFPLNQTIDGNSNF